MEFRYGEKIRIKLGKDPNLSSGWVGVVGKIIDREDDNEGGFYIIRLKENPDITIKLYPDEIEKINNNPISIF